MIVPVYNGGSWLKQCIDSILGQTFRDLECWLIDDGSTDGSGAVCDAAAAKDSRVHVIHKQNEGLMATWMRGVRESNAPYLSFVDCDDWIEPDMLEKMAAALEPEPFNREREERSPAQVICGNYIIEREKPGAAGTQQGKSGTAETQQEFKKSAAAPGVYTGERLQREIKDRLLGNEERTLILSRCMKLTSRKLIEDNLHYCDPAVKMGEDVSIMVPALLDADRVVVLDDAYDYHYRFVGGSMVHRYDSGMYDNMVRLRQILYHVVDDKNVPDGRMMADREFLFLLFYVMKNEIRRNGVPFSQIEARVQEICRAENTPALIRNYPGKITDPANRILSFMMRKPAGARIRIVKKIFDLKG